MTLRYGNGGQTATRTPDQPAQPVTTAAASSRPPSAIVNIFQLPAINLLRVMGLGTGADYLKWQRVRPSYYRSPFDLLVLDNSPNLPTYRVVTRAVWIEHSVRGSVDRKPNFPRCGPIVADWNHCAAF